MLKKKTTVRDNLLAAGKDSVSKVTPRERMYEKCGFFNELATVFNEATEIEKELHESRYDGRSLFVIADGKRIRLKTLINKLQNGELIAVPTESGTRLSTDYLQGTPIGEEIVTDNYRFKLFDEAGFSAVAMRTADDEAYIFMHKNFEDEGTIIMKYIALHVREEFLPIEGDTKFWAFQGATNK